MIICLILKNLGLDQISKNYRPVSNLSSWSNVVEKCALTQFTKHCDEEGLLPTYPCAYRKKFSCKTALVKHFDDLLWSMEQQKINPLVAIDVLVAFDAVDYKILIDVFNSTFHVRGKPINWDL